MTTIEWNSLFIGGDWVEPASSQRIDVVNANTEEHLGSVPEGTEADIDRAVEAARRAFEEPGGWAEWEPARRAEVMERLADALHRRAGEMAERVSSQNGMPVTLSQGFEGEFPGVLLRYYAELARTTAVEEVREALLGGSTLVRREPIGVVGAIVPWNFPQCLAAFKYAPALAAGCTLVMKPSPETVLDSVLFAEAVAEAEVPSGVINVVPAGREVGAYLVSHPGTDKVAFTGSTAAGRQIAETCGRLLRPVTLELGGKSAAIVLDDATLDLSEIADDLFGATLLHNGQTCYLGTRVLAPQSRYAEVVDTLTDFARGLQLGDALDTTTQVGPMVSARHRDRVESYIAKGRSQGSRLTTGGGRPADHAKGWFVEPTIFADVDPNAVIAQEEIFGPVLAVIPYRDVDDAVRIANDSDFGLGGSVWTSDPDRGVEVAKRVQTGTIGINKYRPDPTAPFGGVKASGIGRELGPEALANYCSLKSIYL